MNLKVIPEEKIHRKGNFLVALSPSAGGKNWSQEDSHHPRVLRGGMFILDGLVERDLPRGPCVCQGPDFPWVLWKPRPGIQHLPNLKPVLTLHKGA